MFRDRTQYQAVRECPDKCRDPEERCLPPLTEEGTHLGDGLLFEILLRESWDGRGRQAERPPFGPPRVHPKRDICFLAKRPGCLRTVLGPRLRAVRAELDAKIDVALASHYRHDAVPLRFVRHDK